MASVHIAPASAKIRPHINAWCAPRHPPIFSGEPVTDEDRQLALALWRALPLVDRRWYVDWYLYKGKVTEFAGVPLTEADITALNEGNADDLAALQVAPE